jgi:NDP-sugar pyrophosphorylase family protein
MQFVIQTGGEGTRLKKISKGKTKVLVKINNKSLIDYQIEFLKKYKKKK